MSWDKLARPAYAAAMGVLFSALQAGCFFELQFRMTAAYPSFLTVTVGWLAGSVVGLWAGKWQHGRGQGAWLVASLIAYQLLLLGLQQLSYEAQWLPVLGILIVIMGMHAGHFFAANRALFPSAARLFFWENNGFVLGWSAAFAGHVCVGERLLWILPLVAGGIAAWLRARLIRRDEGAPRPGLARRNAYLLLFLAGLNLILLNYTMVRQMTLAFRDPETAVLLMVLAYFAGLSLGYLRPDRIDERIVRRILPYFLVFQLILVSVAPLLFFHAQELAGRAAAYALLFLLVMAGSTSLYAVFLPRLIQSEANRARQLYAVEIAGSLVALLCLPLFALGGMTFLYTAYLATFLAIAVIVNVRPVVLATLSVLAVAYLTSFDLIDKAVSASIHKKYYPDMEVDRVIFTRYSPYHKIEVIQGQSGDKYLVLNGLRQFGPFLHYHYSYFVAAYPATFLRNPRACILGCGSMSTAGRLGAIAESIQIVDIDSDVCETSRIHFAEFNRLAEFANWTLVSDDAKHYLATTERTFDLIIDDIPPAETRQIALTYTREFFELVKARLSPGGIFSLPSLTATSEESDYGRRMLATLVHVFDQVYVLNSADTSYFFATDASLQLDRETLLAAIDHPSKTDATVLLPHEARELTRGTGIITVNNMADLILR